MKNLEKRTVLLILAIIFSYQLSTGQTKVPSIETKKGTAIVNGLSIAFEAFGKEKDETVLLIQGTGAQMTAWPEKLCLALAGKGYRVIRFDHRDVGLSSKLDALGTPDWASIIPQIGRCDVSQLPYTLRNMGEDAVGLMDALKIKKAHIVGVSMGGAIAQLIAIYSPSRTLSLTSIMASSGNPKSVPGNADVLKLMGTPPPQTNNQDSLVKYLFNIYKAMESPRYPTPDAELNNIARQSVQRSWYPAGVARQAAAVIVGESCDRRTLLNNVRVPTVVIHGDSDPVVNIEAGKEVAQAIPNSKFLPIAGMGHNLPNALTDQIVDAIVDVSKRN
jgi:pimeloyl-ACP methyl ester carboxylesterase